MKRSVFFKPLAVALSTIGILLPQSLWAAQPAGPIPTQAALPTITDVRLHDGGLLRGQVMDATGLSLSGTAVTIRQGEREIGQTVTDGRGQFAVQGLRGGTYQVVAGQGYGVYRLWAPHTAPPIAQDAALLVSGDNVVRGQGGPLMMFLTNPWVVTGIILTAIAVPIAVHNRDRGS